MSAKNGHERMARALSGGSQELAQLLTWLEQVEPGQVFNIPELLSPCSLAFRIGITGPPGAGKSTLVNGLIRRFREGGKRVGVIAVDPSSPFSNGAVLGDRIRYSDHFLDPMVFIRSLGTRGSLGGLSRSAFLMARAFDALGFDILLIETVGVGQSEFDVLHVADLVTVVLVPESGDSIQAMKAGLMEIADVFVVNKADRPGSEAFKHEIEASVRDGESVRKPEVFSCVATEDQGIEELADHLEMRGSQLNLTQRWNKDRLREEARSLLRWQADEQISKRITSVNDVETFRALF